MDKLTVISGTLFMAADVFAIVSLAMPDWIITDVGGDTRLGLMWSCITLYNRPQVCFTPDLQPEWLLALICIFIGCICITTTVILLASSHFDRNVIPYARWVGFAARLSALFLPTQLYQEAQQTLDVADDFRECPRCSEVFCPVCCHPRTFDNDMGGCLFCFHACSAEGAVCNMKVVVFCLAAVIFPMGFHVDEIGGQPYQLPNSHQVGISYILFVLSLWITVISELFAGKVCLPHF